MQLKLLGINCIGKEVIPICEELNPAIIRKGILGEENKIHILQTLIHLLDHQYYVQDVLIEEYSMQYQNIRM